MLQEANVSHGKRKPEDGSIEGKDYLVFTLKNPWFIEGTSQSWCHISGKIKVTRMEGKRKRMGRRKEESRLRQFELMPFFLFLNSAQTISNVHMTTQERALAPANETNCNVTIKLMVKWRSEGVLSQPVCYVEWMLPYICVAPIEDLFGTESSLALRFGQGKRYKKVAHDIWW